jgi:hypothetical protein
MYLIEWKMPSDTQNILFSSDGIVTYDTPEENSSWYMLLSHKQADLNMILSKDSIPPIFYYTRGRTDKSKFQTKKQILLL